MGAGNTGIYMGGSGALGSDKGVATSNQQLAYNFGGNPQGLLTFDASNCSAIYSDSATTVTPESLKTGFYIKF